MAEIKKFVSEAALVELIAQIKAADTALTNKIGVVPATVGETATSTVIAYVDAMVAAASSDANSDIKELEDLVGTAEDGKDAATVFGAIAKEADRATTAEKALQDAIDDEAERAEGAEEALQGAIDAEKERAEGAEKVNADAIAAEEAARKAQIGDLGKVGEGEDAVDQTVKGYVDAAVAAINGDADTLEGRVAANEAAIETINGEGEGSIKKAAADAVATVLDEAPQSFDTLKEIAEWIQASEGNADGFDAAKRIVALETALADGGETAEAIQQNAEDIADLQELVGETAVATQISNAINALGGEATSTEGKFVTVKVTTADGEVSAVNVTEADIASDAELKKVEALIGAAELAEGDETVIARVAALEGLMGEDGDSVADQIAAAIGELNATEGEATVAEGNHVAVQVVEAAGVITGVTVKEADIASAAALAKLQAAVGVSELAEGADAIATRVGALETKMGATSVETQINTAIEGLDAEVTSDEDGVCTVKVTQVDGKIDTVEVTSTEMTASDVDTLWANTAAKA